MSPTTRAMLTYGIILLLAHLTLDATIADASTRMICRLAMLLPSGVAVSNILRINAQTLSQRAASRFLARGGASALDAATQARPGSIQGPPTTEP